jgi:hypothetical protein
MNIYIEDAIDELKRADHLIYVSLKYTRTVDIIKSIVERLINSFDFAFLSIMTSLKEKAKMIDAPKSPGLRASMVKEFYKSEPIMLEFIQFYNHLREISRAEYKRSSEYRRHVTMTAMLDSGAVMIDIDKISEYYKNTKVFVEIVRQVVENIESGKDAPKLDLVMLKESVITEMEFNKR